MRVFLAVVADLINFVLGRATDSLDRAVTSSVSSKEITQIQLALLPEAKPLIEVEPKPLLLSGKPSEMAWGESARGYILVAEAKLFIRPVWAFDTVVTKIKLGEAVLIYDYSGRFVRVKYKDLTGWVLKDEVTLDQNSILPDLQSETVYLANDTETKKLRAVIADEFFASELYLPLLGVEYVYYRLLSSNRPIPWTEEKPRPAGNWKDLLKGRPGVRVGIEPKTGSIMEYFDENGEGKIGYIEAVHPDLSIVLHSVGRLKEGQYLKEDLTKEEWQLWGPVSIQIQ